MQKVLVTGATGFVGRHLCDLLARRGYQVVGTARSLPAGAGNPGYELHEVADIGADVDWDPILDGVDCVVHLAARVHVMDEQETDPLAAFRRVNVEGTQRLLRSDGMRNVKRCVFLSTVKVHGEATRASPFTVGDTPAPADPYAQSKLEAERCLEGIGSEIGLETVIIRPPLVYGPGVGGNFYRLMKMVSKGVPLPFGRIDNRRSLVGVENLCDLILECLSNPSASGNRFLVSDNSDVSTAELVRAIASVMGRPARLLPVPQGMLVFAARLLGKSAEAARLTGSLQVDTRDTMRILNWQPPLELSDGVKSAVDWYQEQGKDA